MKLTKDEIARIEAFLSLREHGLSLTEIAAAIKASNHVEVAHTNRILRLIGIAVPASEVRRRSKRGPDKKPRKQRTHYAARPIMSRPAPARTILTAEQWQERLSAHGF